MNYNKIIRAGTIEEMLGNPDLKNKKKKLGIFNGIMCLVTIFEPIK